MLILRGINCYDEISEQRNDQNTPYEENSEGKLFHNMSSNSPTDSKKQSFPLS